MPLQNCIIQEILFKEISVINMIRQYFTISFYYNIISICFIQSVSLLCRFHSQSARAKELFKLIFIHHSIPISMRITFPCKFNQFITLFNIFLIVISILPIICGILLSTIIRLCLNPGCSIPS